MRIFLALILALVIISIQCDLSKSESDLVAKLSCRRGETRLFHYDSRTKLWGASDEEVKLSAFVGVHCMGKESNNGDALKYLVQVTRIEPRVSYDRNAFKASKIKAKSRTRRGAEEWFKNAWGKVKNFFVDLFRKRGRRSNDEPRFDMEFDDETITTTSKCRPKTESNKWKGLEIEGKRQKREEKKYVYDEMFELPFEFLQLPDGTVEEIRFSDREKDESVKNFKKHIADTFATQLNRRKTEVMEKSPVGEHKSHYIFGAEGMERLKEADASFARLLSLIFRKRGQSQSSSDVRIVRDISERDMVKVGSGDGIIHDPSRLNLKIKQIQQISGGHMTTTAGHLSLNLMAQENESRMKREVSGSDIGDYLKVNTQYSMKREADLSEQLKRLTETESKMNFISESLVATSQKGNIARERLTSLRDQLASALKPSAAIEKEFLTSVNNHKSENFNKLIEVLDLEEELNETTKVDSFASIIRSSVKYEDLRNLCGAENNSKLSSCKDLITILLKASSRETVQFLLNSFQYQQKQIKQEILKLLVQTNNPDAFLIFDLLNQFHTESDIEYKGSLITIITVIASKPSVNKSIRSMMAKELIVELQETKCTENDLSLDLLEAAGNLGHEATVLKSIEISRKCNNSLSHQLAVVDSLRKLIKNKDVQNWFAHLIEDDKVRCELKKTVITTLIENIDENDSSLNSWPKFGFNKFDETLVENVITTQKNHECIIKKAEEYFSRKIGDKSKQTLEALKFFEKYRKKRAAYEGFWDDAWCEEKVNEKKPSFTYNNIPVVSDDSARLERAEEFNVSAASDKYWRRKRCKAYRYFGPRQARAHLKADLIADAIGSEQKPDYKLLMQFSIGTHFLGKDIDIGKIFVYQKKEMSRAYINVLGRTFAAASRKSCDSESIEPYKYSIHVPLYDFNIWIVQVSLGLRLDSEMGFSQASCKARSLNDENIIISPEATVKAAGEASGKVLIFRGGTDIGGEFNYFSEVKFDPEPGFCLSVSNGHNPMSLSVQPWFEHWDIMCNDWSERTVFKPKNLNWELKGQEKTPWIQNQ
ncbi:hypothetical protein B4U79_11672 [Dinothrombium tinctorium]|uniref:Vitellogenin domain-containing protein n=1 Tax=Dinothrombium tinctorium TaxID=1965070 RepID=A0A3S3Q5W3_9ACAR|nr:hypothetical protein B4U79_11672 [Dinothrombium tinctorium]